MESHQTSAVTGAEAEADPRFSIRPLLPADRERLAALFAGLIGNSGRLRYRAPKHEPSERELTYQSEVDHTRHEALVAIDAVEGSIVGVARYAEWGHRPAAADVALEVAGNLQRRGIGLMLAEALVRRAREHGFAVLTATTLWENRPARALAHRLGFMARASLGAEIELELYLPRVPGGPKGS